MADVLVVGAATVGLTMAGELARHSVRCRAIGVTPRTLEVWEDMGVAREMIDAGLWLEGSRSIINDRRPAASARRLPICPTVCSACRNMRRTGFPPAT
jgi:2-polyprenyl-6-methoxyphenol hydroxylase-like FAD-dependent oxidoreductase